MIHVSFITIDRNINYINESIDSCIENCTVPVKINVYSGCEDISYIKNKERINQISCLPDDRYEKRRGIYNHTANYVKALIDTKLIFEDDVCFTDKWNERIQDIEDRFKNEQRVIVSLYNGYDHSVNDSEYIEYNQKISAYWSLQGVYYPRYTGLKVASYILDHIGANHIDNTLGNFCSQNNYKIFYTNRSIIQHIGEVSSFGDHYYHRSKTFLQNENLDT
jgi:hypothetical protein